MLFVKEGLLLRSNKCTLLLRSCFSPSKLALLDLDKHNLPRFSETPTSGQRLLESMSQMMTERDIYELPVPL